MIFSFTSIVSQRVRKFKKFAIFQIQTFEPDAGIRNQNKTRQFGRRYKLVEIVLKHTDF